MIKIIENGNLFDSECEVLVNTVNCVGIMGKGIALEFKKRYPKNYELYRKYCYMGLLEPGGIYYTDLNVNRNRYILNFATKNHWKNPSKIQYIEKGINSIIAIYKPDKEVYYDISNKSIAFPALGCSNGGLDWNIVKLLMIEKLKSIEYLDIEIYGPLKE